VDSAYAGDYDRLFTWTCLSCEAAIRDRGPHSGPENDEEGHARDCSRLAAAVAEREAQREAGA